MWGYVGKGSRFLPKSVRDKLSASEKRATNRKKAMANREGKTRAKYSNKIRRLVRKTAKSRNIAVKKHPKKWQRSVKKALKEYGGKRSALMYLRASRIYQEMGGKYVN